MERIEHDKAPGATAALIRLLGSENENFRCLAVRGLGRIGTRDALEPLIERLGDEDEDVSQDAALALGELADPRAVDALCEYYTKAELPDLKVAAVEALGRLGGPKAAELLLGVAHARDPSWGEIMEEDWDGYWDAQLKAVEALGIGQDHRAVTVLAGLLDNEEGQDISAQILVALARMGPPGEQVLLERLWNGAPIDQRRAAELLAARHTGNANTEKANTEKAATENGTAENGTAKNGTAENVSTEIGDAFLAGVAHPEGEVRAAMLRALNGIGETLPWAKVQTLLKDPQPEVRVQAVGFLAHFPPEESAAEWFLLARDPRPEVRRTALEALTRIGVSAGLPLFHKGLEDPGLEVVLAALSGLAALRNNESLPLLAGLLEQERQMPAVKVAVISALQTIGTPQALVLLHKGLTGPESQVRLACLRALVSLHGHEAGVFLVSVLRGELAAEPGVENSGEEILETHRATGDDTGDDTEDDTGDATEDNTEDSPPAGDPPEDPAPPLSTIEAIQRESEVDHATVSSLKETVGEDLNLNEEQREFLRETRENLKINEKLLKPKPHPVHLDLRVLAARLIGEGGHPGVEAALLEALEHPGDDLRKEAAEVLGLIGGKQAVPALLPLLESENWEVRLSAVRALWNLGAASSVQVLIDAKEEPHPIVRREAVIALTAEKGAEKNAGKDAEKNAAKDTERGAEVIGLLRNALGDENAGVVRAAAMALLGRGEAALLPEIVAGMERHPGYNWDGLGRALATAALEDGRRWILGMLADPAMARVIPLVVALLEELELAGGTITEPH